jgi:hypothetical protein
MPTLARRHSAPGTNERKYPHVVQLAVGRNGLDVGLGGRIMHFHNSRHIKPRHGHIALRDGWCFSDLAMAHTFIEQFGGSLYEPERRVATRRKRLR